MQRSNGKRLSSALMSAVFVVSSLMTVLPAYAAAAEEEKLLYTDDDISYVVNEDNTVTIKGWKVNDEIEKFKDQPLDLPSIIDGKTVTAIDSGTQFQNLYFTEIHLPENVQTISDWAFSGAYCVTEVTIPATVTNAIRPFTYAHALEKVTFEEGRTEIPQGILASTSVKTVVIPDSVTKICDGAFDGCGIEEIHLPSGVNYIGRRAFTGCRNLKVLDIPDKIDFIGDYSFAETPSLESLTVPETWSFDPEGNNFFYGSGIKEVTFTGTREVIPKYICNRCENLETINYPEGVKTIDDGAFQWCFALKDPKLPDTVENINYLAFQMCKSMDHLDLPENLTTIGMNAFQSLYSLKYLYVPHDINNTPEMRDTTVFYSSGIETLEFAEGVTYIGAMTGGLSELVDIRISDTVTQIGTRAFDGDAKLSYINIPDSVTSINGGLMFQGCISLHELTLPAGVDNNKQWIFQNAPALEVVYIKDGMERVPDNLFTNCKTLKEIHLPETVTEIGEGAFSGCENLETLVMPQDTVKTNYHSFEYTDNLWDERVSMCKRGDLFVNKTTIPTEDGSISNYTVFYSINPRFLDGFSGAMLRVSTAEPNAIAQESIDTSLTYNHSFFDSQSNEPTGTLRFSVRNPIDRAIETKVEFMAKINGLNDYEHRHVIIANKSYNGITLNAPESVGKNGGKPSFAVYGYAEPDKTVSILVNGAEFKTVTASKYSGKYSLTVEADDVDGTITVQAVCGDRKSAVYTVSVVDSMAVLKDFEVSHFAHDRWTVDMTDMFTTGYSPYVPVNPGNPLEFDVDMDNDDNVAKVFVESDTNGKRSYIGLDKDSETGHWKGEGFFDTAIPGNLTVRSVPINKEDTLTVKRDSEGTVESVKNKAGKELLKQEEGASKDPAEKFVERTEQTIVETGNSNIAVSFRKKPKSDTGSAPYLPPEETEDVDFELNVFVGSVDSIDYEGKTLKPIDIVEDHGDFSFEKSNTKVIDSNGEEHEYFVRVLTKEDQEFAQTLTKGIALAPDSSDKRSVNDFLTDKEIGKIIEGVVIADLNKATNSVDLKAITYTGDSDLDSHLVDQGVGAGTSAVIELFVNDAGLKGAAGYGGAAITSAQAAYELYGHYVSHEARSTKIDYSKDQFVRDNAQKLKVTSASLFIGRAAIAAVAIKGSFMLAAAGLAFWPGLVAAAALSFGVWALGKWYDKLEKDLDDVTDPNTPSGRFNSEIDPSGIAYEWLLSNPVKGVTAEIYYQDDDGNAVKWNAEDYDQENPQITDSAGWFAWDVPEGMWQVHLSGEGYEDAQSEWVPVLPVQTEVNIALTSKLPAEIADAGYEGGKVMVKFTKHMLDSTITSDSIVLQDKSGKAVDFDIAPVKEEGNDTAASMTFILTPKNDISLSGAKVGVKTGAQSYAGVACKDSGMTALRELAEGELPQPAAASALGDVNDDGFVDSGDASLILSEYALLSTGADSSFTDAQRAAADVNSDSIIDSSDASSILAYYAMASTATGEVPTMAEYMKENAA